MSSIVYYEVEIDLTDFQYDDLIDALKIACLNEKQKGRLFGIAKGEDTSESLEDCLKNEYLLKLGQKFTLTQLEALHGIL